MHAYTDTNVQKSSIQAKNFGEVNGASVLCLQH